MKHHLNLVNVLTREVGRHDTQGQQEALQDKGTDRREVAEP